MLLHIHELPSGMLRNSFGPSDMIDQPDLCFWVQTLTKGMDLLHCETTQVPISTSAALKVAAVGKD